MSMDNRQKHELARELFLRAAAKYLGTPRPFGAVSDVDNDLLKIALNSYQAVASISVAGHEFEKNGGFKELEGRLRKISNE